MGRYGKIETLLQKCKFLIGAVIDENVVLEFAIVGEGAVIRKNAVISRGCILTGGVVIDEGVNLPEFTRICMKRSADKVAIQFFESSYLLQLERWGTCI